MVARKPVPTSSLAAPAPAISLAPASPGHRPNNPYVKSDNNVPDVISPAPSRPPPSIPTAHPIIEDYFKVNKEDEAEEPDEKDWWDESDDEEDIAAHPPLKPERTGKQKATSPQSRPNGSAPTSPTPQSPTTRKPLPSALKVGNAATTQAVTSNGPAEPDSHGLAGLSIGGDNTAEQPQNAQTYTRFGNAPKMDSQEIEDPSSVWAQAEPVQKAPVPPPAYRPPQPPSHQPLSPQLSSAPVIASFTPARPAIHQRQPSSNAPIPVESEDPWREQKGSDVPILNANPRQAFNQASLAEADPWAGEASQTPSTPPPKPMKSKVVPPAINTLPPGITTRKPSTPGTPETPQTKARRQRNELYQVKTIRWYDQNAQRNPRSSPIMVQNANGPCPLLALVNALVLTTPAEENTALVETLSNREQVSLGLLLDAVFDELTSDRRGDPSQDLPDIGELYSFLSRLNTGMNVNPRFVDAEEMMQPLSSAHPGTFEETKEMRLYSTFHIPLIHGWIPHPRDSAFAAFCRQKVAQTYDDAQNMQFHAEELEAKFHSQGLSDEEQDIFADVIAIKEFLTTYPTQLSDYGLDTIKQWLQPGQVVILFRNDHFSTLYKQPDTGRLLTLVTDEGYASHDEIVWESLADVNGAHTELFSGDFRSVSHSSTTASLTSPAIPSNEWTTVKGKTPRHHRNTPSTASASSASASAHPPTAPPTYTPSAPQSPTSPPPAKPPRPFPSQPASSQNHHRSPSHSQEQEDADLALALQLQEEEEAQHRSSRAARAAENEASERYVAQQNRNSNSNSSNDRPPPQPPRPTGNRPSTGNGSARREANMPVDNREWDGEAAPPPPYSPSADPATSKPYLHQNQQQNGGMGMHRPPMIGTGPSQMHMMSGPASRRQSAYSVNSQYGGSPGSPSAMGRRRLQQRGSSIGGVPTVPNAGVRAQQVGGKADGEEKCVVM